MNLYNKIKFILCIMILLNLFGVYTINIDTISCDNNMDTRVRGHLNRVLDNIGFINCDFNYYNTTTYYYYYKCPCNKLVQFYTNDTKEVYNIMLQYKKNGITLTQNYNDIMAVPIHNNNNTFNIQNNNGLFLILLIAGLLLLTAIAFPIYKTFFSKDKTEDNSNNDNLVFPDYNETKITIDGKKGLGMAADTIKPILKLNDENFATKKSKQFQPIKLKDKNVSMNKMLNKLGDKNGRE